MTGCSKAFRVLVVVVGIFCLLKDAQAQMEGKFNGFEYELNNLAQTDWALSTSGIPNPNNIGKLSTDGNTWNLMAYRLESRIKLTATDDKASQWGLDSLSALIHPLAYLDLAPEVDGHLPDVNLFGGLAGGNYPGNGWMVQTTNINEGMISLPEAYVDLGKAGFNLRLGKQRIVWSPMTFVRVLDCVDALDYRRHSIWGPVYEGFDDQRIGEWTANLTYQIPQMIEHVTKASLQAFVSPDFEPTIYPTQGSTYSMISSGFIYNDAHNIATARHKIVYGAAWKASIYDFDLSLNFVSSPQLNGVTEYTQSNGLPGAINGTPYVMDPNGFANENDWRQAALRNKIVGLNDFALRYIIDYNFRVPPPYFTNPFRNGPIGIAVTDVYPRAYTFGGSISHFFGFLGGTGHLEMTYTPQEEFRWMWMPATVSDSQLSIAGMFRREFAWGGSESISPTILELEYWYKSRSDFFDRYASSYEERDYPFSVLMIEQPLMDHKLIFDYSTMLDVSQGGGAWIQPGVRYQPTAHWSYAAYYNYFFGGQRDTFGEFSSFDEVFMRVTYKF
jgi:hypothetical protein